MEEESKVTYHETNEGRDTDQGFAGFEGSNALWLICAIGLSILFFRQSMDVMKMSQGAALGIASMPIVLVCMYVFGLKQGKPKSYDVELFEWLLIKLTKTTYFGPKQVEPIELEWVNVDKTASRKKWQES